MKRQQNFLQQNFWRIIASYAAMFREHRTHRNHLKQMRRHGKALRIARKEADAMHKATGKAYYVLPDANGQLRVLDKAAIRNLKRFKIMSDKVTVIDLLTESEYNTMNNHFLILVTNANGGKSFVYFRGTIDECLENHKFPLAKKVEILGGFERIVTRTDRGTIIKH